MKKQKMIEVEVDFTNEEWALIESLAKKYGFASPNAIIVHAIESMRKKKTEAGTLPLNVTISGDIVTRLQAIAEALEMTLDEFVDFQLHAFRDGEQITHFYEVHDLLDSFDHDAAQAARWEVNMKKLVKSGVVNRPRVALVKEAA